MAYRDSYGGGSFGIGYGLTPWVKRLLIANAAMFLATFLVRGLAGWLALVPGAILARPWTPLTYMFVHGGFLHLLFNMLGLFFFGPPLEQRWGSREFIKFYLIAGLGGAIASLLFAQGHAVIGASAAVFGIMLAFAMNWPNVPIYFWGIFPIKAKWLIAIMVALNLFSAVGGSNDGIAHFAHLGGFAAAFLYLKLDDPVRMRFSRIRRAIPKSTKLRIIPGGSPTITNPRAPLHRQDEERLLDEVDRVLDKISKSGIASLTPEEHRVLDEASRRYRSN